MDEPHETQRPLAGAGEFVTPQDEHLIEAGFFTALAIVRSG
jgi:hypothetical protein